MPVHSIVAAVMGDLGKPELLLAGRLSEHAASFTPSQIAGLGKADLVFLVGKQPALSKFHRPIPHPNSAGLTTPAEGQAPNPIASQARLWKPACRQR